MKAGKYDIHHAPFGDALGPDVAYGLALRQEGFMNYIDWSLRCAHYKQDGEPITMSNTAPAQVRLIYEGERWRQSIVD